MFEAVGCRIHRLPYSHFRVIFASFEAALLTQGNENGVESTEKGLRQTVGSALNSLYDEIAKNTNFESKNPNPHLAL